ncbi:hypothetical protein CK203_082751 [Vitis vinifera]|uniref:Uncharacterized protein n=1 Tax=Vitis vinifera TaxID=29760 RepID=A0A438FA39_VITVI|nr:hypothetical protein CK203_082751 [Vitis vinifera]
MSAKKKSVSSVRAGDAHEKPTDKLSVKEFRDRFCIPNGVMVEFLDEEEVMSTEKAEGRTIIFSKEQFNAGLRFPLPALFKEFLHFSQIPPAFIHPNIVRVLMGCSIINMLFNLDLTLLELPDSTKGGAKGYVVVWGAWAGLLERPGRPFSPNYSMVLSSLERRGHIVDWVEKTSFACLNKLFEIDAGERHYETLLTARNLMAVVRESQEYIVNILPRKLPKEVVPGALHSEGPPFLQGGSRAESATQPPFQVKLQQKGGSWSKRGKDWPRTRRGTKPFGAVAVGAERLSLLVEEATSINQPGSPHPDGDAARAICVAAVPLTATPLEEMGAESQSLPSGEPSLIALVPVKGPASKRSCSARNLKSGLIGRLQDRFQEIEVSCSSAQDAHPEGSEVEMATETPAVPVVVPDEGVPGETHPAENVKAPDPEEELPSNASLGGNPVDDAACTFASPFSYAELEEKLKQIPPGSTVVMPSAKMFEVVETLVSGLRGMTQ